MPEGKKKRPKPARGRCPVCRYRFPLRKDHTLSPHFVYYGWNKQECSGGTGGWKARDVSE